MTPKEIATILAQHAEWLRDISKGAHADLRGADLSNADLRGADMRGADMRGADLRYTDLSDADLSNANLRGADLRGANLRGANLDFAAWPLWCGSLQVALDERQQAQLLYHVLAVSPVARRLATPEMLAFANGSHVVEEHNCERLTNDATT